MPQSTMQDDYPLTIAPLFAHGRRVNANSKVITFTGDGYTESTFAEVASPGIASGDEPAASVLA